MQTVLGFGSFNAYIVYFVQNVLTAQSEDNLCSISLKTTEDG